MNIQRLLLAGFFLFVSSAQAAPLCVQTFNAYGPAYARNLYGRTVGLIESMQSDPCDVLQLQEAWQPRHYDQLAEGLSGMHGLRPDAIRGDRLKTGLASFSSRNITSVANKVFSVNNVGGFLDWIRGIGRVEKGFSAALAEAGETSVLLLNTHTHPQLDTVRLSQFLELTEYVLTVAPLTQPLVLTGDFNATPASLEYALLRDLLLLKDAYAETSGYADDTCTYCERNPLGWGGGDRVIDFVLYRTLGTNSLKAERARINLESWEDLTLSDHYGVRAYFDLAPAAEAKVDESVYQSRLTAARATLDSARKALEESGFEHYRPHLEFVARLAKELEAPAAGSRLENYFRQR